MFIAIFFLFNRQEGGWGLQAQNKIIKFTDAKRLLL
jgi:hypothetical protein